jgi:hypothetical protein
LIRLALAQADAICHPVSGDCDGAWKQRTSPAESAALRERLKLPPQTRDKSGTPPV